MLSRPFTYYCVFLFLLWGVAYPALAQTMHQVSPRTIERTVTSGDVVQASVSITNTYPYVINVYPSVHDLIIEHSSSSTTRDIVQTENSQFIEWTTLTRAAQRLQPDQTTVVDVRFVLPNDLAPGTYHGLLGFGQAIDRATAETAVQQGTAPGVVVRFTVPEPDVRPDGAATLNMASYILSPRQTALAYTLYNPGTRPMLPAGEIVFLGPTGGEVAAVPIHLDTPLAPGEVVTVATTAPSFERPGRYHAKAQVDFNDTQVAMVRMSDNFWYLPWQLVLGILVLILILSILVYRQLARLAQPRGSGDGHTTQLPMHVYQGESEPEDHDINLRT